MQSACAILNCNLWHLRLFHIFSTLPHKRQVFREEKEHKVCVLIFSTTSACNIFHSKKNSARYYRKRTIGTRYTCQILMKLEFSRQIVEKTLKYRILFENPTSGSGVVPWGKTGRHDEANSHFSQFCKNFTFCSQRIYEGRNFNSGNYLFTTDTK